MMEGVCHEERRRKCGRNIMHVYVIKWENHINTDIYYFSFSVSPNF